MAVLNVRDDFGAIGDGETDDDSAFQDAIAAHIADGHGLYVPIGQYCVSGPFPINGLFCIRGEDRFRSVLIHEGDGDLFDISSSGEMRGFTVTSPSPRTAGVYFDITSTATFANFLEVQTYNAFYSIKSNSPFLSLRDCTFSDTKSATGISIIIENGGVHLDNVLARNALNAAPYAHLAIFNAGEVFGTGVNLVGAMNNFYVAPSAQDSVVASMDFVNSRFDNAQGVNVNFSPFGYGVIGTASFTQCWLGSATNMNFNAETANDAKIDGVTFNGVKVILAASHGMRFKGNIKNVNLTSSLMAANGGDAVRLEDIAGNFLITGGNRIGPCQNIAANGAGVRLLGTTHDVLISGNSISGNTGGNVINSATGQNIVIGGNI